MFTRLSCKITDKLEHNGTISKSDRALYEYGLRQMFTTLLNILTMLLIGLAMKMVIPAVLYTLAYDILYSIVYEGADHSSYALPDLANADGYFTEDDLSVFGDYVASARDTSSGIYLYNHEMTGDTLVNIDDYNNGIDKINTDAQKREASDNYYEYMDKNNDGTIDDYDVSWFSAAYLF